jgi:hypothetical protein
LRTCVHKGDVRVYMCERLRSIVYLKKSKHTGIGRIHDTNLATIRLGIFVSVSMCELNTENGYILIHFFNDLKYSYIC